MGAQSVFMASLDILFSSNHNIHKSSYGLCFWASDNLMIDFTKIFQLKGLKLKDKGHTNFYECCNLTKKVYLLYKYLDVKCLNREILIRQIHTCYEIVRELLTTR